MSRNRENEDGIQHGQDPFTLRSLDDGRGHRAEVALALGQTDVAMAPLMPLLDTSDDPEYRAPYAEVLCRAR